MVINYSKWDALELSDDSDIEVHPNVDKRSFIRAKQNQIHQQRWQRRHEIQTLKYERIINDGLLERIDRLIAALRQHEEESSARSPEELVFQALMEATGDPNEDKPPAPPEGVYTHEKEQPKYSQMMSSLVDQVKKEIEETKPDNVYQAYITGVEGHKKKVMGLQQELLDKLAQLEKEEKSKITSDDIHTGFDSSFITKDKPKPKPDTKGKKPAKKAKTETVELLNPGALNKESEGAESDGEDSDDDPENVKASDLAKEFAKIKVGDYRACLQFISEHPEIVAEKETDGLLVEAFNSQMDGKDEYARQCVHQGLLLQYCRSLGRDGINLFFKRYVPSPPLSNRAVGPGLTAITGLPRRTTRLRPYLETMSMKPTTKSRPVPLNSKRTKQPTTNRVLNRSSCTLSIRTRRSTLLFLQRTAMTRLRSRRARFSTLSRLICRRHWNLNPWTR